MREVFYESTASDDVLVDKNGDPLNLDKGSGGSSALHSYFRIDTSGGTLLGSSGARDVTYGLPWVAASPLGSGTQHEAPVGWESGSGKTYDTIVLNEGGLWMFDYTLTAQSQGSVQNWDHVMMFLTFMVDGGVVALVPALVLGGAAAGGGAGRPTAPTQPAATTAPTSNTAASVSQAAAVTRRRRWCRRRSSPGAGGDASCA